MSRSRAKDRAEFAALMLAEGVPVDVSFTLMRHAATLHRLAEAQCNGDWPADNGERKVKPCPKCEQCWVPSFFSTRTGVCRECGLNARLELILSPYNCEPIFQGDPRGSVFKVKVPSGRTNDWGREGICVP